MLEITDLAFGGRGVGRLDALVVFVEGALPGESVRARILRVRRGYAEAETVEVLRASARRVRPPCRHYAECGGCDLQHFERDAQARAKRDQVGALIERIARIPDPPVAEARVPGPPLGYRFRMDFDWQATAGREGWLGLHRRGRPDAIVPIQRCELTSETVSRIVAWMPREAATLGLRAVDRRRDRGLLRRVSIQEARGTGEILITLETGLGDPPALATLAASLTRRFPRVVGVARRAIDRDGLARDSILAGRDHLFEQIETDRFIVPAQAFFQPNPAGAAALRREALAALEPRLTGRVLELYAGVGFFTVAIARRALEVLAIEGSPAASAAARRNAAVAGVSNCRFVTGEVGEALPGALAEGWDAVLLDPPRGGLPPDAALALASSRTPRIVYVSCDPATLARDLGILATRGGYRLESVVPYDLFPQTHHVECVARLGCA